MPDEPTVPPTEEKPQETAPEAGQATTSIPEKFQGKSTEEIIKAYEELSKTIGKQGEELGRTKKEKEEYEKIVNNWNSFLEADPELYKTIEEKVKPKVESNGEAPDEIKQTITKNVVKEFEDKNGISNLDPEKAQALRTRIGQEVQEFAGVSINDIPLSKLDSILEKGYRLATLDDREETARRQGIIEARQNREAEIGSIQSTGVNSQTKQLTPDEQVVARKLHISDEDYAKYK